LWGGASSSAVQSAFQTLETDLKTDNSSGALPTGAAVGQLQTDLNSIRNGNLTGSQAQTTIQSDATAVLTSMGLSQSQISQIQTDQAAVESAIQAAKSSNSTSSSSSSTSSSSSSTSSSSSSTSSSSSSGTASVMQSVEGYLVGLPGNGFGGMGMRGFRGDAMGGGFGTGGGLGLGGGWR
jgi:hypothetical protein